MKKLKIFFTVVALLFSFESYAQCTFRNTAFEPGEKLSYNLYYNWKFVWIKAGSATLNTVSSHFAGKPTYKASLITRTNSKLDRYFVMRDTILCHASLKMEPLYYRKAAREGKRYYIDEVFYSYPNYNCHVKQHRVKANGDVKWKQVTYNQCQFDMLNIFLRARSFNPKGWKKGHVVGFPIISGNDSKPAMLKYRGIVNVKADNGHRYRCLQLSYMEKEDGDYKRIVDFYITDDTNHVPIRLDMFLRFGVAKAYLTSMKGLRNDVGSLVK